MGNLQSKMHDKRRFNIVGALRHLTVAAAAMLSTASGANAGQIATPMLFQGDTDQLICIATNVSNGSVRVRVRIIGNASTTTTSCNIRPGDRGGCQHFLNNQAGYCIISNDNLSAIQLKERVRGVMFTRSLSAPFALEAVVQAE